MITMFRRRVVDSALSLFFLICAVFFLARLTGSPAMLYLPLNATPAMIETFNRAQGFDKPIFIQFVDFLRKAVRLDFGDSLRRQASALDVVLQAYPTTLYLAAVTIAVALVFGVLIGCLAALRPNSIFDRAATAFAVSAASLPDFWMALLCILIFAVGFGWLPTSGMGTPLHWVLPVLVLMTRPAGSLVQVVRGSMVETLSSPYVKAARGRGVPTRRILFLHALRNGAIPAITVLGVQAAGILNGAVVVETIFGWPGIGRLMITAVLDRDFAVMQAAVVVIALVIFALNMVIDLLYGVLDPRGRDVRARGMSGTPASNIETTGIRAVVRRYLGMLTHDRVALTGVVILIVIFCASFIGPYFVPKQIVSLNFRTRLQPPPFFDFGFFGLMGTDALGRSMLGRLIVAGQTTLTIAVSSAFLSALIGSTIGIAAGYRGGWADGIAMRAADVILSFPMLLLAIAFLYILKPSITNVIIILVLGRLPLYVRVARAESLEIKQRLFVDAARCLGAGGLRICVKEIAPVIAPTILTLVALDVGLLMLTESSLSFLGIGIQPPAMSWGLMVAEGRQYVGTAWWLTVFPGLAIFLTALCCNLVANWLRLAFDPTQRWRLERSAEAVAEAGASITDYPEPARGER